MSKKSVDYKSKRKKKQSKLLFSSVIILGWLQKGSGIRSRIFEIPVSVGEPDSEDLEVTNVFTMTKQDPVKSVTIVIRQITPHHFTDLCETEEESDAADKM